VTGYLTDNPITDQSQASSIGNLALIHGYHVSFFWGAMLLIAGLIAAAVFINARKDDIPAETAIAA
jgi:hypothetical protein